MPDRAQSPASTRGSLQWLGRPGLLPLVVTATAVCLSQDVLGLLIGGGVVLGILAFLFPEPALIWSLVLKPVVDVFWSLRVDSPLGRGVNFQSIIGAIIPAAMALGCIRRRMFPGVTLLNVAVIVYLAVSVLTLIRSPAMRAGVAGLLQIWSPFGLFWVAQSVRWPRRRRRVLLWSLAMYAVVPFIGALLQFLDLLHPNPQAVGSPEGILRVVGFFQHPLDISWRAAIAMPFIFALASECQESSISRASRAWAAITGILGVVTMVRSALVAMTLEGAGWLWFGRRRRLSIVVVGGALLLILLVPPLRYVATVAFRPLKQGDIYELGTGRAALFLAQARAFASAGIEDKLLGRGLGSVPIVTLEYAPSTGALKAIVGGSEGNRGAHNEFFRALTEAGLFGLGALLTILVAIFRLCARGMAHAESEIRTFAKAVTVVTVGLLVYCMTGNAITAPATSWPFWTAIGFLQGSTHISARAGQTV